ncbi:MAG: hypothetical protein IT270_02865 [Saprospiraceae bacterium]|nr:hypothetical protein [Saprospiraceae bacterium]
MKHQPNLKNFKTYLLLSVLSLSGLWSCRPDVEEFRPYDDSLADISRLLAQVTPVSNPQSFVFGGAVADTILSTSNGVRVFLSDTEKLFADSNGNTVTFSTCPNLSIEIRFINDRSDLISLGRHTMTTEGKLLESLGMVDIRATCDGTPLQLLPGRSIKVQIPSNQPLKSGLKPYIGNVVENTLTGWENNGGEVFWADWQAGNSSLQLGYEFLATQLGLQMIAIPFEEPLTSFCVTLPENFNRENSVVYVLTQNVLSLASLTAEPGSNTFCIENAPFGYPVEVFTISKIETDFLMGYKQTEIGTNATVTIEPDGSSMNEVIEFIKSL